MKNIVKKKFEKRSKNRTVNLHASANSNLGISEDKLNALENLDKDDLLKMVKTMMSGGITVNFYGKRSAEEIDKQVRPRQTKILKELCEGTQDLQSRNCIIEGENLQAMVTLYKERGQVDLIITDPPYNTGQYFRYHDKWDTDPNDPELGQLVKLEDGSRHTKWLKAMLPRLNMILFNRIFDINPGILVGVNLREQYLKVSNFGSAYIKVSDQ